jgi:hypothetical protein
MFLVLFNITSMIDKMKQRYNCVIRDDIVCITGQIKDIKMDRHFIRAKWLW